VVRGGHVLIVEDNNAVARSFARILRTAGYCVDVADSLASARHHLAMACREGRSYRAVLLDLGLPDGDGADLLSLLEALGIRVIVVTANYDSIRALQLHSRCDLVLPKPVSEDELLAALRRVEATPTGDTMLEYCNASLLSRTEGRFLHLVAHGLSNADAALVLGCSESTTHTLWKRIRQKTGCNTNREVLASLLRFVRARRDG
jgi:DNA-binding NarL/FixJ family response regulator